MLSPSAGFTTTQTGLSGPDDSQVLGFGPRGSLTAVPPGFGASTVAFAGRGVGATMRRWGLALMRKGGKDPDLWKTDFSMRYLGYTTDNGAYYYYNTMQGSCHGNGLPCEGYEPTIHALKAYTLEQKLPVRWILYDSWFYSKANGTGSAYSPSRAALNWSDADPSVFPSGMRALYRATGPCFARSTPKVPFLYGEKGYQPGTVLRP